MRRLERNGDRASVAVDKGGQDDDDALDAAGDEGCAIEGHLGFAGDVADERVVPWTDFQDAAGTRAKVGRQFERRSAVVRGNFVAGPPLRPRGAARRSLL